MTSAATQRTEPVIEAMVQAKAVEQAGVAQKIGRLEREYQRAAGSVGIPACPEILMQIAAEAAKHEPDTQRVARLVSKDVGLAAALIKMVNSPFYGLKNKVGTVKQAISLLGLLTVSRTMAGLVLRQSWVSKDALAMERFWDGSAQLATAAALLAGSLSGVSAEEAYTFGLFRDCGIAVLMQKFPTYRQTLGLANRDASADFTEAEHRAYGTDHATIGALLTRTWHLPENLFLAIRFHHDYATLAEAPRQLPARSLELISLGVLADRAVELRTNRNQSVEWEKGGEAAMAYLRLAPPDLDDLFKQVCTGL